jgi:hypothetical protein
MQYITNCAVIVKGSRVSPGTVLDLSEEEAAPLLDLLTPHGDAAPEEEAAPEVEQPALHTLTVAELKEKAAALGLALSGSKADLVERITLHQAAQEDEA